MGLSNRFFGSCGRIISHRSTRFIRWGYLTDFAIPQHSLGEADLWLAPHKGSAATGVVSPQPPNKSASEMLIITCFLLHIHSSPAQNLTRIHQMGLTDCPNSIIQSQRACYRMPNGASRCKYVSISLGHRRIFINFAAIFRFIRY